MKTDPRDMPREHTSTTPTNDRSHGEGTLVWRGRLLVRNALGKFVPSRTPHDGTRVVPDGGPQPSRRVRLAARYKARREAGYAKWEADRKLGTSTLDHSPFEVVSAKQRGAVRSLAASYGRPTGPGFGPAWRLSRAQRVASTQGKPLASSEGS